MRKTLTVLFVFLIIARIASVSAQAGTGIYTGRQGNYNEEEHWDWSKVIASTDNGSYRSTNTDTSNPNKSKKGINSDLKALYDEFQKFWVVKDSDDLQDRFEDFLKTKNISPEEIENYDEFMETWVDHFDEDLDFDDLYNIYDPSLDDVDDPDEYDVLLDNDVDDLYDDYLDDYIDEEYYEDYGEYFDEVYYD